MAVITDAPIDALRTVLSTRINGNAAFAADFRETMQIEDGDCLPINQTYPCDPFSVSNFADAVASGNSAFPILGMWRSDDDWEQLTFEDDEDRATCSFKYILPASQYADRIWPLLKALVAEIRRYLQAVDNDMAKATETSHYHAARLTDLATLRASGLTEFAVNVKAKYGYDGPNRQSLYPTATGSFVIKTVDRFDPSALANWTSLEAKLHLVGSGQDGDADPAINPLVTLRIPPSAS